MNLSVVNELKNLQAFIHRRPLTLLSVHMHGARTTLGWAGPFFPGELSVQLQVEPSHAHLPGV